MNELINIVITYLEGQVEATRDLCGEDDEINYLPAKKALDAAKEIKALNEDLISNLSEI